MFETNWTEKDKTLLKQYRKYEINYKKIKQILEKYDLSISFGEFCIIDDKTDKRIKFDYYLILQIKYNKRPYKRDWFREFVILLLHPYHNEIFRRNKMKINYEKLTEILEPYGLEVNGAVIKGFAFDDDEVDHEIVWLSLESGNIDKIAENVKNNTFASSWVTTIKVLIPILHPHYDEIFEEE